MAGSLAHIIAKNGSFNMALIENLRDACGALDECFHIILHLSGGDMRLVSGACNALNYPDPYKDDCGEGVPATMTGCQHQWTESQIRTWKDGDSDVLIMCSKCGANMELADFLTEVANGL